jgi:hypothetical protein
MAEWQSAGVKRQVKRRGGRTKAKPRASGARGPQLSAIRAARRDGARAYAAMPRGAFKKGAGSACISMISDMKLYKIK